MKLHALNQRCEPLTIPLHQNCFFPFLCHCHNFPKRLLRLVPCLLSSLTFLLHRIHLSNESGNIFQSSIVFVILDYIICHIYLLETVSLINSFSYVLYLCVNKLSYLQL